MDGKVVDGYGKESHNMMTDVYELLQSTKQHLHSRKFHCLNTWLDTMYKGEGCKSTAEAHEWVEKFLDDIDKDSDSRFELTMILIDYYHYSKNVNPSVEIVSKIQDTSGMQWCNLCM